MIRTLPQRSADTDPIWPGKRLSDISQAVGGLIGKAVAEGKCDDNRVGANSHTAVAYSARLGMALVMSDTMDAFPDSVRTAAATPCDNEAGRLRIVRDVSKTYSLSWNISEGRLHLDNLSPPISDENNSENPMTRVQEILDADDCVLVPHDTLFPVKAT